MADWSVSIANAVSLAARAPTAVSPATADTLRTLDLSNLGCGYPDKRGGLSWRSDGTYGIDFDLSRLASSSSDSAAPTGWRDLLNDLGGVPGLSANPADWGNYGGRNPALRLYRPHVQRIAVMPGEDLTLEVGIYWPSAASGATGVRVRVVDEWSGKGWNGSAWASGGVLDSQSSGDAWKDITEEITADATRTERSTYSVILEPIASSYGATTYCYASMRAGAGSPAIYPKVTFGAVIGHNLPANATVALAPQPSGTSISLTPAQPSMYGTAVAQSIQTWRLNITMPTGNQPRPLLGEVWIGSAWTLPMNPGFPVKVAESSPGQIVLEGARLRREILADEARSVSAISLIFKTGVDASFVDMRDRLFRATRSGADPILLMPGSALDGAGRVYHGRLDPLFEWQVETMAAGGKAFRTFSVPFLESPFASP